MTLQRILYVEDEPLVQTIAKVALVKVGGFNLRICDSGAQALQEVKAFAPQLILLDVVMPGMDGPATLVQLRQDPDTAAIPVVFLTANTDPKEIAHYRSLGAVDVIAKPYNPMTLAEQVRQVWAAHHA
ncbi:MAG: response regulator [Burkholderiales bacterium]|jgi:two-component system OmpR family response regulator|nr:response regulator [Burkholderiales bacterium]MBK9345893.1 response regulator [Burkholderiales bacterium]